jgi:hypothetical protein
MTRFPPYPRDILDRADALLSSKYPDGIVDPALVELLCEMAMEERHALFHRAVDIAVAKAITGASPVPETAE